MRSFGFTLIDLLTTLAILSILLAFGLPSFTTQIQNTRVKTAAISLLEAIDLTRTKAVFSNSRATIAKQTKWEDGWEVFIDKDNDGARDQDEDVLQLHEKLNGIKIISDSKLENYVSYIGTGEGRRASGSATAGAIQIGSLKVCPIKKGTGYQLILSRGGRVRMNEIKAEECNES